MKGQLYIDNKDVFTELGVATLQGNYGELVAFPSSKTPDSNDWTEEDGKEFDLSSITLDSREFSLEFGFFSEWKFNDFVALLSDSSYHDFNFPHLGRTFRLRLSSQNSFEIYSSTQRSKFTFANDFPVRMIMYIWSRSTPFPCRKAMNWTVWIYPPMACLSSKERIRRY